MDTSDFAENVDLDSLKTDVGKFDIDKLKIVPTNINNMKSKVNKIDTGKLKTGDLKKLKMLRKEIPLKAVYDHLVTTVNAINTSELVLKTDCNTKIKEIEAKIPPDHDKYITTPEFNKLTKENFDERLKQENLASKNDITDFIKNTGFDETLRKN